MYVRYLSVNFFPFIGEGKGGNIYDICYAFHLLFNFHKDYLRIKYYPSLLTTKLTLKEIKNKAKKKRKIITQIH